VRLALVGFGNVGRRFAELLRGPYGRILRRAGVEARVTGIATARHGSAIDGRGLSLARCLGSLRSDQGLSGFHRGRPVASTADFIRRVPADVLLELTTLDPRSGQPAIRHVRTALHRGLHVITANKGPAACGLRSLSTLARKKRRRFLFEGAVMDGTPVFNLVARCLPGARVLGFRGMLNTTTARILSGMENGTSFAAALRAMQLAGIAEADPANDVEGWDAAAKGCAIANALMGARVRPTDVERRGIAAITERDVRRAVGQGCRLRLVVHGERIRGRVRVRVAPEALPVDDPLVSRGSDGVLILETDLMGEIGILEGPSGVDQTAYAILSDLMALIESGALRR
jgi:homoserine dehydrogenase